MTRSTRRIARALRQPAKPAEPDENVTSADVTSGVTLALLGWYDRHRRALPWRALSGEVADPYAVWLSEIMLQQTTVATVKAHFAKFLALWPRVEDLAAAPLDDVMRAWAGLGYYSRARNLHACAQAIVTQHGGRFPDQEAGLRALPGVGAYTAAAIAAIAFGRRAAVVDGNVERVMARLFAIDVPMPKAKSIVTRRMDGLTPAGRPGDFAQAVMDLGATVCVPRNPLCAICPLSADCLARAHTAQGLYPVKAPKKARPVRHGTAYYVRNARGDVLVQTRPAKGLLGSMTELPGTDWTLEPARPPEPGRLAGRVTHVFTHFTLLLDVVVTDADRGRAIVAARNDTARWVPRDKLADEALPTLMRNAIALAQALPE